MHVLLYKLASREQWQISVALFLQLLFPELSGEGNVVFAGSTAGPQQLAVQRGVVCSQVLQPCWQGEWLPAPAGIQTLLVPFSSRPEAAFQLFLAPVMAIQSVVP